MTPPCWASCAPRCDPAGPPLRSGDRMTRDQDLCQAFAQFAANASYDQLPESAIQGAKHSLLDTLGVILAASGLEPAKSSSTSLR